MGQSEFLSPSTKPSAVRIQGGSVNLISSIQGSIGILDQPIAIHGTVDIQSDVTIGTVNLAGTLNVSINSGTLSNLAGGNLGTISTLQSGSVGLLGQPIQIHGSLGLSNEISVQGTILTHGSVALSGTIGKITITDGGGADVANVNNSTSDGQSIGIQALEVLSKNYRFNGDTWDRWRGNLGTISTLQSGSVGLLAGTIGRINDVAGTVSMVDQSDLLFLGTQELNIVHGTINLIIGAGSTSRVLDPVSERKIRIIDMSFIVGVKGALCFHSGSLNISGSIPMAAYTGFAPGYNPKGYFETASGSALNLSIENRGSIGGWMSYVKV